MEIILYLVRFFYLRITHINRHEPHLSPITNNYEDNLHNMWLLPVDGAGYATVKIQITYL